MPSSRLYISDLDGTLLNAAGELSSFTRSQLRQLLSNGLNFTIASARSLTTIRECLGDLPLKLPIIHMNGGWITDYAATTEAYFAALPLDIVKFISKRFSAAAAVFLASGKLCNTNMPFCAVPPVSRHNAALAAFVAERRAQQDPRIIVEAFQDHFHEKATVSFTLIEEPVKGAALIKELQTSPIAAQLVIYPMGRGVIGNTTYEWTTIQSHLATKGHGALFVAKRLGIHAQNLVVFGDNVNDLSLLNAARRHNGQAYCMGNGTNTLKAAATAVLGSHHDDSVVHQILELEGLPPIQKTHKESRFSADNTKS